MSHKGFVTVSLDVLVLYLTVALLWIILLFLESLNASDRESREASDETEDMMLLRIQRNRRPADDQPANNSPGVCEIV